MKLPVFLLLTGVPTVWAAPFTAAEAERYAQRILGRAPDRLGAYEGLGKLSAKDQLAVALRLEKHLKSQTTLERGLAHQAIGQMPAAQKKYWPGLVKEFADNRDVTSDAGLTVGQIANQQSWAVRDLLARALTEVSFARLLDEMPGRLWACDASVVEACDHKNARCRDFLKGCRPEFRGLKMSSPSTTHLPISWPELKPQTNRSATLPCAPLDEGVVRVSAFWPLAQNSSLSVKLENRSAHEVKLCLTHFSVVGGPLVHLTRYSAQGSALPSQRPEIPPSPNYQPTFSVAVLPAGQATFLVETFENVTADWAEVEWSITLNGVPLRGRLKRP